MDVAKESVWMAMSGGPSGSEKLWKKPWKKPWKFDGIRKPAKNGWKTYQKPMNFF
jgi:hypothetical protein